MKPRVQARKKIKVQTMVPEIQNDPVRQGYVRVLRLMPRERVARPFDVPNTLPAIQTLLGGDLEAVTPPDLHKYRVAVYVDENGGPDLRGLPLTLSTDDLTVRGPVLFCGLDAQGETVSITSMQHAMITGWLRDKCKLA